MTNSQKHIVKRQILELKARDRSGALRFQQAISGIVQGKLQAILDKHCSIMSSPDVIHRIESIELDLGTLDSGNYESQFLERLDLLLPNALAAQLPRQESHAGKGKLTARGSSQLECVVHFLETGTLPWWQNASAGWQMSEVILELVESALVILQEIASDLIKQENPRRRLVLNTNDEALSALSQLLQPQQKGPAEIVQKFVALLKISKLSIKYEPVFIRQATWLAFFETLSIAQRTHTSSRSFQRAVLLHLARTFETTLSDLVIVMSKTVTEDETAKGHSEKRNLSNDLQKLLQALQAEDRAPELVESELHEAAKEMSNEPDDSFSTALIIGKETKTSATSESERLSDEEGRLSDTRNREYDEEANKTNEPDDITSTKEYVDQSGFLESGKNQISGKPDSEKDTRSELFAQRPPQASADIKDQPDKLIPSERQRHKPSAPGDQTADSAEQSVWKVGKDNLTADSPIATQIKKKPSGEGGSSAFEDRWSMSKAKEGLTPKWRDTFSDTDALYVANAGMVILWPFLENFFLYLNLFAASQFLGRAHLQRAVGLLQFLVTEDTNPAEHLLPLNKVICGMGISEVFEFGPPITEAEKEECSRLLEAAIGRAPVLNNMSIAGFRGSFLIRNAVLSTRDGAWLLRVERETYDIVLDRFPWTWNWIKLPWMQVPVRVEW